MSIIFHHYKQLTMIAKQIQKKHNHENAQIILISAREGRDVIKNEIGIEIIAEEDSPQSADIFDKLRVRKDQDPTRPLAEGKLE